MYIIWDTKENKYCALGVSGKTTWQTAGAAKSAMMSHLSYARYNANAGILSKEDIIDLELATSWYNDTIRLKTFSNQKRYECWEADFVKVKKS